jgi:4-amino-4-deoxy-L-arabinose transferase-like glycosyltransferase
MTDPVPGTAGRKASRAALLALAAILVFFGLLRLRLLDTPLERDEGEYAYTARIMLNGSAPYLDSHSMKLPGIFLAYAGMMLLFGQTAAGIHLGLLLAVSISTLLVFVLARRLLDDASAVAAAAVFALLSSGRAALGFTANAEPFLLPFALAGLILLRRGFEGRRAAGRLFLSGLFFGAAFLVKQHGAVFGLFGGAFLLFQLRRPAGASLARRGASLAAFAGGTVLPFGAACLVFWRMGIFRSFWFYTVVYARTYVAQAEGQGALNNFLLVFSRLVAAAPLIWLLVLIGIVGLARRARTGGPGGFLLGLAGMSFLSLLPGFYFRPHYFILMFPAAALLAGAAVSEGLALLGRLRPAAAGAIAGGLAVLLFGGQVYLERGLFFAPDPKEASWQMYGPTPFTFNEARDVALMLKPRLSPSDKVAVMGSEPQIYFYLERPAPTPFIYLYYLTEGHAYAADMRREFIADIERARPEYLITISSWRAEYATRESYAALLKWYEAYRDRNYELTGLAEIVSRRRTVFLWGEEARRHKVHSRLSFLIYRRTE